MEVASTVSRQQPPQREQYRSQLHGTAVSVLLGGLLLLRHDMHQPARRTVDSLTGACSLSPHGSWTLSS